MGPVVISLTASSDVSRTGMDARFERLLSIADYTVRKAVTRLSLLRWTMFQRKVALAAAPAQAREAVLVRRFSQAASQ